MAVELAERTIRRLESGERRTRASTLARLAEVLAPEPDAGDVLEQLLFRASPALAPESACADRVGRRRARRAEKRHSRPSQVHITVANPVAGGVFEAQPALQGRGSLRNPGSVLYVLAPRHQCGRDVRRGPRRSKVRCGRPTIEGTPCQRYAPARVGVCLQHAGPVCTSPVNWSGRVCLAPSTSGTGMTATCDRHFLG